MDFPRATHFPGGKVAVSSQFTLYADDCRFSRSDTDNVPSLLIDADEAALFDRRIYDPEFISGEAETSLSTARAEALCNAGAGFICLC